jgi:hypothetical protein
MILSNEREKRDICMVSNRWERDKRAESCEQEAQEERNGTIAIRETVVF